METGFERKLAAIMFTDVVGYSALVQKNETQALQLLRQHFQMVRGVIAWFNGNEIKTIGDAFLIEFASAVQAVNCAIAIQEDIQRLNKTLATDTLARADEIHIRIGIHLGDIIVADSDVFGDGVNIASRIEPHAPVDGICLSEDMARQVLNKINIR